MAGVVRQIMDDIANDPMVDASKISVEELKVGSLLKKKNVIHIFGSVGSEEAKARITRTAQHVAGVNIEVQNDLKIKGPAHAGM